MVDFVFGTADELRQLAAVAELSPTRSLVEADSLDQVRRVEAVQARYPGVPLASLAGRIFCGIPDAGTRARVWHTIRNLDNTALGGGIHADLYLYGEIGEWGITASEFVQALGAVAATDITLHLNSPGGEVFEGMAIYNALRDHPAATTVQVDALAASAASVIAMAGDRVVMNRQSRMMIHDASGLVIGNAADMRMMADLLDTISDDLAGIYAARAGGTANAWRKQMKAESWFGADQAVAAGLADEAITTAVPDSQVYAAHQPGLVQKPPSATDPGPDSVFVELAACLGGLTKEAV